jgi:hypothetical protein
VTGEQVRAGARVLRGRFRGPTYVNLATALALLGLLLLHLTTQPTTSPPTIAEISPQAVAQIKKQPPQQATKYGTKPAKGTKNGDAGGNAPGTGKGPGPGKGPGSGPGGDNGQPQHQCFGDPPRQTEDPQSPPCVPFWSGDNGGATSMGVTTNTITVVAPTRVDPVLVSYFNQRFEFYGRHLEVKATNESACDTAGHQAAADTDVQNWHPFAAGYYFGCYGIPYYVELARKKVVSVASYAPVMGEDIMRRWHPYIWQYGMDTQLEMANLGDWACHRLVGRKATHAGMSGAGPGAEDLSQLTRKIAVIQEPLDSGNGLLYVDVKPLTAALKACDATALVIKNNQTQNGSDAATIQQLKDGHYTTVFCACTYAMYSTMSTAKQQLYYPEWVVSSIGLMDTNYYVTPANPFGSVSFPSDELQHMFGLTFQPRQVDADNSYPALAEEQTTDGAYIGYDSSSAAILNPDYRWMLLLASGIQLAGPHLTPESFARGLEAAEFPNPENKQRVGKVGFGSGRHGMTIDGAEMWWQSSAHPPFTDTDWGGSFCYADHGKRYQVGEWPTGPDPFFTTPCDSGGPGSPPGSPMGKPGTADPP